jgi:hypothetical protein
MARMYEEWLLERRHCFIIENGANALKRRDKLVKFAMKVVGFAHFAVDESDERLI